VIKLFSFCFELEFQLSWGKLRKKPATQQFDWSFAPLPTWDERFARQCRYEPPPEFPLASPSAGKVHCFSGPDGRAPARFLHASLRRLIQIGRWCKRTTPRCILLPTLYFHYASELFFFSPALITVDTRTHVRLLGPCCKTGRFGPFNAKASWAYYNSSATKVLQPQILQLTRNNHLTSHERKKSNYFKAAIAFRRRNSQWKRTLKPRERGVCWISSVYSMTLIPA